MNLHDMQCGGGEGGAGQLVEQHGSGGAALEVHHQGIILGSVGGGSSQQRRQEECPEKGSFHHLYNIIGVNIYNIIGVNMLHSNVSYSTAKPYRRHQPAKLLKKAKLPPPKS